VHDARAGGDDVALGQIRKVDPARHTAVIALEDGREVSVTFAPDANIEVMEPATLGTMGGRLEDLKVGYWVEATLSEPGSQACSCTSIQCLS
jgi:hypothetical protein